MLLMANLSIEDIETRKVTHYGGSKYVSLPKEFANGIEKVFLIKISDDVILISRKKPEINISELLGVDKSVSANS